MIWLGVVGAVCIAFITGAMAGLMLARPLDHLPLGVLTAELRRRGLESTR